jgi:hypothetical protein
VTALLACGALLLGACGEEHHLEVIEGEGVELGELTYNVQLTRFLNEGDTEDASYLVGQPDPPAGKRYLGVFMKVTNDGSEPATVAGPMEVVDTRENVYDPIESESEYALDPAAVVEPDQELPEPGSTAAAGPIKGSMLLFLVDDFVTENRPLELEIPGPDGEKGLVELDL